METRECAASASASLCLSQWVDLEIWLGLNEKNVSVQHPLTNSPIFFLYA